MKPLALVIVIAFVLSGCNNLNDLRPVDPAVQIPQTVVNVVKDKFPQAEDLVFKPILQDKIWEVNLKSNADQYSSLVDYGKMWETFKIVSGAVPAALQESVQKSVFAGGTLSGYSTAYFATTAANKLIYEYKNEKYSFEWSGTTGSNGWAFFDPALYRITTYDLAELPASVNDTIRATANMTFVTAQTWIRTDDSRLYYVTANKFLNGMGDRVSMLFDGKGKLRWSSTAFSQPGVPTVSSNIETVPAAIQQYVDSLPELSGFGYNLKLMNNYGGLVSYYITLSKGEARCELYFDKDFNMLNKKYFVPLQ